MYIRKENLQNRSRPLGNAIFRSVLIFVNKNYRDGVLTYLRARDMGQLPDLVRPRGDIRWDIKINSLTQILQV